MAAEASARVQVEVIYAVPGHVWRRQLEMPAGATVQQALAASGLLEAFTELCDERFPVGIYGRSCTRRQVLQDGDRLEIYRPLVFDPMESRRRRARHRERKRTLSGT